MKLLHIYTFVLILTAIAYADDPLIPAGNCTIVPVFNFSANLSDNSTAPYSNVTYCAQNLTVDSGNYTLWVNSSHLFNNGSLNVSCLGNLSITVVNNTTIQQCNATSATMWANSSLVINNAAILCLGNMTTQNVTNVIANCSLNLNVTPTSSDQVFSDSNQNYSVRVSAIPSNYCYQNVNQQLSGLGIYRSDITNTTVICKVNADQLIGIQCPTPQNVTCPAAPACPEAPNCDLLVKTAVEGANNVSTIQLSSSQASATDFQNRLTLCQLKETVSKNATEEGIAASQKAFDDKMWFVPYAIAAFIGCVVIVIAGIGYNVYSQNRDEPGEKYRSSIGKEQAANYSKAGKEKNVFEVGGKQ